MSFPQLHVSCFKMLKICTFNISKGMDLCKRMLIDFLYFITELNLTKHLQNSFYFFSEKLAGLLTAWQANAAINTQ